MASPDPNRPSNLERSTYGRLLEASAARPELPGAARRRQARDAFIQQGEAFLNDRTILDGPTAGAANRNAFPEVEKIRNDQIEPVENRKRARSESQLARDLISKKLADQRKTLMKANREVMKRQFPKDDFGKMTMYAPRHTAAGREKFGETYATATPLQLANRALYGWTGDGEYFHGNGMYKSMPGGATGMVHTGRFSGEGGFFDDLGNFFVKTGNAVLPGVVNVAKDVARSAAPIVGNAIMPGLGGAVGTAAANAFLGSGEYEHAQGITPDEVPIKYNNLINSGSIQTKSTAVIESAGDETGDLIFTHNEYIHDLTSRSTDFHTLERFEINPGVFASFPLLSQFAQHYEEYDFIQCIFEFKSLVTDGNATAAGSVMLCPNYNASNPNLPDKRSIENASGSVSGKVTNSLFCGIECANDKTAYGGIKYVRTVDIDSAGRRMYDLGFLQIATQGVPAGLAIGELWCRYKVRLSKMKVGGLKVPAVGSGFVLATSNSATTVHSQNFCMFNSLTPFNHTPTVRALLPPNATMLAGDDIANVALSAPNPDDPRNTRVLTGTLAVVGGSQITVNVQYTEVWRDESMMYSASHPVMKAVIDHPEHATDCTIPYTATRADVTYSQSTALSLAPSIVTVNQNFTFVFGTPGQIGKLNLRITTGLNATNTSYLDNELVTSDWAVAVVRNA